MSHNSDVITPLHYPTLSAFQEIIHFTSTRSGGISTGTFESLNLGIYTDDSAENITTNLKRFLGKIGLRREQLHLAFQTHEDKICIIDKNFIHCDKQAQRHLLQGIDALITNLPGACIAVTTADCVPLLLYDPKQKVVAAIHAGWRSSRLHIVRKTIIQMQETFSTHAADIVAILGPSISAAVYEVGEELFNEFEQGEFETEKIFFRKDGKLHLDLWKANEGELIRAGVKPENITISGRCSYSEGELFFSARRQTIRSGRMITGIMLKS